MKAKEANLLAEKAGKPNAVTLFDDLLRACWFHTEAPGPYRLAPDGSVPWQDVLVGDRLAAMLGVRIATYGATYAFPVRCTECSARFEWELELTDLPWKPYGPVALQALATGQHLTTSAIGKVVTYRLVTGTVEAQAAKLLKQAQGQLVTASLANRIVSIEGVETKDKMAFLEDLDLGLVRDLSTAFEEHEGGLETSVLVTCDSCGAEKQVDLPFDRAFWLPKR